MDKKRDRQVDGYRVMILIFAVALLLFNHACSNSGDDRSLELWYDEPARIWEEALPIGNGSLGAMIYGLPEEEHIQFNEETLWDCGPGDYQREGAWHHLGEIRSLLFEGKQDEAEALAEKTFMGNRAYADSFEIKKQAWLQKMTVDPRITEGIDPGCNESNWPVMMINGKSVWERNGLPDMNGCVLFRKTIDIPEEWAGKNLTLALGNIKDHDITWINGIKIGEKDDPNGDRTYTIPASAFHGGRNVLAVQISNFVSTGGFNALRRAPFKMYLVPVNRDSGYLFIEGEWRYRVINTEPPFYPQYEADYQPFGDIRFSFPGHGVYTGYRRSLDLTRAMVHVSYKVGDVTFNREYFASSPDSALVIRLSASRKQNISFDATLSSPHRIHRIDHSDDHTTFLALKVADGVMSGRAVMNIENKGGSVKTIPDGISVEGADEVVIRLVAATNFINYKDVSGDPAARSKSMMTHAMSRSFAELEEGHLKEYRTLFNRFEMDLVGPENNDLPINKRLTANVEDPDNGLAALYVQYARYLLISSARQSSMPPNLQGIWNDQMYPPWGSKYTTNINCEMNMWPSEPLNLPEMHTTLFTLIGEVAAEGHKTARAHYNADGWVLHHNTDQWRGTAPINASNHGIWVTGGAWLSHHLWEHYLYSCDTVFLRNEAYPVIKGSAQFFMDFLIEDPVSGYLISTPSNSPEQGGLVAGPAMDHQIIRSLFKIVLQCSEILDTDYEFAEAVKEKLDRIAPDHIGKHGQLQEWMQDIDDINNHHRHVSHLWAVYPGAEITMDASPDFMEAAKQSLIYRGDGGTGWSLAWKINLWARFQDGNHAYKMVQTLLSPALHEGQEPTGGSYPNLLDAHPPFQIDGNFGGAAGIVEMLMQSHQGYIHLLPALPDSWPEGHVKGLCARGGFEIEMSWKDYEISSLKIISRSGNPLNIRIGEELFKFATKPGESLTII